MQGEAEAIIRCEQVHKWFGDLHVLADALTSVLAIVALVAARWLGTVWMTAIFLGPTAEAIGSDAEKFMSYITVKLRYSSTQ